VPPTTTAERAAAEDEGEEPKRNPFADNDFSMVDESVGAAGGGNTTTETSGGVLGEAYGEGKETDATERD